jgi:hypothetical protein
MKDLVREAQLEEVYEYLKASFMKQPKGHKVILSNALTPEECAYLLGIVRQHLFYYEMLIGLPNATEQSKAHYQFIKSVVGKLQ